MNRLLPEEVIELYNKHHVLAESGAIKRNWSSDGTGCCGLGVKLIDLGFIFKLDDYP